jgi:HEAT repeat protein
LALGTGSEGELNLALGFGVFAFVLTGLLMGQVLLMRYRLTKRKRRSDLFLQTWKPLLINSLDTNIEDLPGIAPADALTFLSVWNYLHESLLDESRERLNEVAKKTGIDKVCRKMLKAHSIRKKLLAITALGNLREKSVWEEMVELLKTANPTVSMAAARALVLIDAVEAIPVLIPYIKKRTDWSTSKIASILKIAGPDTFSGQLARAAVEATADIQPTLIHYLELGHKSSAMAAIHQIIRTTTDEMVIQACLNAIDDPVEIDIVRSFLDHPHWLVRMRAAAALGRIGQPEDEQRLVRLLSDREWWVRYRAAQALAKLPHISLIKLEKIQSEQTDKFARDMVNQVIAERISA